MKERKLTKKKSQQILATLVMGMNLVNSLAPMAAAMQKLPEQGELQVQKSKSEAKPLEYTVLPQTFDFVENIVFSKAEATEYNVESGQTSNIAELSAGDRMSIGSGGIGSVGKVNAGYQDVKSGGSGVIGTMVTGFQYISTGIGIISTMTSGWQHISFGGTGTIESMSGGAQYTNSGCTGIVNIMDKGELHVKSGGSGIVDEMNSGMQNISAGGSGTVSTMNSGYQWVSSGGIGTVSTMNEGTQYIYNGVGTVSTMSGGVQRIYSGGTGTVSTMNGGVLEIDYGGTGTISTMNRGTQNISSGGSGTVSTMNSGYHCVFAGGTGTVNTMNGGMNWVNGGTGTVSTMNGGVQKVDAGGSGTISTMSNGNQTISSGGTGIISIMSGGAQDISSGGKATINDMRGGIQYVVDAGTGIINSMTSGIQWISFGGTGAVDNMNDGIQYVRAGTGTIIGMENGIQNVDSGGSGVVGTMNSGIQNISSGGTGTIRTMIDGKQSIFGGGTSLNTTVYGGSQYISSGGSVSNTIITGGTQLVLDGASAVNTTLNSGVAEMVFDTAIVSDLTMAGGKYFIGVQGNYKISGKFKFTGGIFDMTESSQGVVTGGRYDNLTIDNLQQGGGTFFIDTDLASETNSDKLEITNAEAGSTYYVQVKDASLTNNTPVLGEKKLLLITDASKNAIFIGKEINNGGIWEITPDIKKGTELIDVNGNTIGAASEWYLTNLQKNVNKDTEVLLEGGAGSYALWRNTTDTLRKRLGELHIGDGNAEINGVWVRYTGGKYDSGSENFDGSYNMYQLGYDKADNEKSIYGFAIERGDGKTKYTFGSGEDKVFTGSLYGTWKADDGSYTDVVAKIGQFDTDIKSYGEYPDKASYKNKGYSLSVEYGKTIELNKEEGTFIEPQAQLIIGRLSGSDYTTERGNKVSMGGVNSYIGRVGFAIGKQYENGSNVYFKLSLLNEFGGDRNISMLAANGETYRDKKEYGDTWFELGLGTNIKLSDNSYFYGDIENGFGDIKKKWQINAGVRFNF